MEKIDVEEKKAEIVEEETKYIKNTAEWIVTADAKKCSICGAEMRGWAFRQNFNYCPMCGMRIQ